MNPAKSIEILENWYRGRPKDRFLDDFAAMKLGIEALKRHRDKDTMSPNDMLAPLPGETE